MLSPHALYPLVQTWLAVDHHRPPERVGAGTVRAARALAGRLGRADSAREGGACCGRPQSSWRPRWSWTRSVRPVADGRPERKAVLCHILPTPMDRSRRCHTTVSSWTRLITVAFAFLVLTGVRE